VAIQTVEAWTVRLPLARPVEFGAMRFTERDYAIVRVTDESGAQGFGYGLGRGAPIVAAVDALRTAVIGADVGFSAALWETLYQSTITHGQRGVTLRALSLLDIAVWDLRAHLAGVPLYHLLGGFRASVAVSIGGGYFRERRSGEDVAAELARYGKQGFRHIKIPVGGWSPAAEEAWVAAARQSIGDEVELALDAHWTWSDIMSARRVLERLDKFDLSWVEDPLWPEATLACTELRRHIRTPIAIGDEQSGRWAYQTLLAGPAADIWRVDVATVGGFTEFRRVAALAATWGIPISTHMYPELHVHCAAAESAVMAIEYVEPASDIDLSYRFIDKPLVPRDGFAAVPSAPGLGFDLDWEMIEGMASHKVGP